MGKSENKLKVKKKKRVGILGGTFNPPHIGHLILAQEVLDKLALDKIFFIPTNIPPHKNTTLVDTHHRLEMVRFSIEGNKRFSILDLEIKRGGTSYTIDTIKRLRKIYPDDEFYLIIGSELAREFHTWKNYKQIIKLAKIVVAQRKEAPFKRGSDFISLDILQIGISSSLIRELLRQGLSIRYLVHPKVEEYIKKHNLYQVSGSLR
jgi:nicotinate-nucleotide adenylyltransferase